MLCGALHHDAKWEDGHALRGIIWWSRWAWFKSDRNHSRTVLLKHCQLTDVEVWAPQKCLDNHWKIHESSQPVENAGTKHPWALNHMQSGGNHKLKTIPRNVSGARPKQWETLLLSTASMLIMCGQSTSCRLMRVTDVGEITSFTNSSSSSVCKGGNREGYNSSSWLEPKENRVTKENNDETTYCSLVATSHKACFGTFIMKYFSAGWLLYVWDHHSACL